MEGPQPRWALSDSRLAPRGAPGCCCAAPRSCSLLRREPSRWSPVPRAPAPHRRPSSNLARRASPRRSVARRPPWRSRDRGTTSTHQQPADQQTPLLTETAQTVLMERPRLSTSDERIPIRCRRGLERQAARLVPNLTSCQSCDAVTDWSRPHRARSSLRLSANRRGGTGPLRQLCGPGVSRSVGQPAG